MGHFLLVLHMSQQCNSSQLIAVTMLCLVCSDSRGGLRLSSSRLCLSCSYARVVGHHVCRPAINVTKPVLLRASSQLGNTNTEQRANCKIWHGIPSSCVEAGTDRVCNIVPSDSSCTSFSLAGRAELQSACGMLLPTWHWLLYTT